MNTVERAVALAMVMVPVPVQQAVTAPQQQTKSFL